ncbi:chain length regulator/ Tyrosine-protein kinase [Bifidobacterium merycicum]|uniref:non-specific protein-tyrosine kinase n=3 Tax=Bifidobacterium merycicum TaxID=78345 RepID=A0A087BEI6_9BIFI|nr:chain length regulator/ Tyrosine-protein kinase [Bifidobacterium merycicum]SHE67243.1 capsular exopolysaccharide family [Bifidobacterium merycicum DSM 6492]
MSSEEMTEGQPSSSDNQMRKVYTFADLLATIRKHLIAALVACAVVIACVGAYVFLAPPEYTSTAQVIATFNAAQENGESTDISQQNTGGTYISSQIKSYPTLTTTEKVLSPVISKLGLNESVSELAKQLVVTNPSNTAFVNISAKSGDAQRSADIANAVAESLRTVVQQDLYGGSKGQSPIKLTVVQKATVPQSPSSPKKGLYFAIGVVLGIIVGVFAAVLKELLSTKVEETSDVRGIVKASALGSVPKNEVLSGTRPIIITEPNGPVAEEYRRIRANIKFLQADKVPDRGQLLVISSTSPSEGKTTTVINVAAVLAENGAKVLLVDADLRHPSVAHHLGIEGSVGLAHVLSGQMSPVDVVQSYWKPNLHILPAGKRPANASLLLNSDMMKMLIEQALMQYDYVLIDTAPLAVSNDGIVFGSWAKGVVLVAANGICRKKDLEESMDALRTAKVPVLGFVFNFANPKKEHKNAYYYYYEDGARRSTPRRNGRKH